MRRPPVFGILMVAAALSGCASRPAVVKIPAFQFDHVQRISVTPFHGPGGDLVTNEFVRQLLASGVAVSKTNENVDAILSGTVTEYRPNNKVLIFIGKVKIPVHDEAAEISNPVVSPSGPDEATQSLAFGTQLPQMVGSFGSINVTAVLSDPATKRPVWANDASYEALEATGAVEPAVRTLVLLLRKIVPAMSQRAPAG
jgi:hypothetical protein